MIYVQKEPTCLRDANMRESLEITRLVDSHSRDAGAYGALGKEEAAKAHTPHTHNNENEHNLFRFRLHWRCLTWVPQK